MNYKFVKYLTYFCLWAGLLLTVGPLLWMLITAFTSTSLAAGSGKDSFTSENFKILLSAGNIVRWSLNSFFVAAAVTIAQTLFNSLAAFGFSVGKFRGRNFLFMIILAAMMVPGQIVMLPLFLLMASWGLADNLLSLILPALSAPFGIYMVRQYMDSIPKQMVEAARIDGAGEYQIFAKIYFPLSLPILATSGIFIFITQWNAFLWPLIMMNTEKYYTLTVGLSTMQEQQIMDYGLLMAGATLAAVPMVFVFMFFSRYMLEGMQKGAVQ